MKPTTTIAVLCLVVAGASAMNLPWNHKSDSSDAAGSSQSSKHRGLKSAWSGLKTALRPCGRQDNKCTSSEENLFDPKDTHEGQQGIDNPLSEENDASPMTHGSQEIQHAYSSGTSPSNGGEGSTSETDVEREEKEKVMQEKISTSHLEYILARQEYSSAHLHGNPDMDPELAKIELMKKDIQKRISGAVFGKMAKRPLLEDQDCKKLNVKLERLFADVDLPDLAESPQ
ncbi:hypothetical protein BASA83_012021 [Batrachochytrium salamandrivorans]|nr:hypothetical protein BASA83_012021 [Batrachochytrium salamandrivorans]